MTIQSFTDRLLQSKLFRISCLTSCFALLVVGQVQAQSYFDTLTQAGDRGTAIIRDGAGGSDPTFVNGTRGGANVIHGTQDEAQRMANAIAASGDLNVRGITQQVVRASDGQIVGYIANIAPSGQPSRTDAIQDRRDRRDKKSQQHESTASVTVTTPSGRERVRAATSQYVSSPVTSAETIIIPEDYVFSLSWAGTVARYPIGDCVISFNVSGRGNNNMSGSMSGFGTVRELPPGTAKTYTQTCRARTGKISSASITVYRRFPTPPTADLWVEYDDPNPSTASNRSRSRNNGVVTLGKNSGWGNSGQGATVVNVPHDVSGMTLNWSSIRADSCRSGSFSPRDNTFGSASFTWPSPGANRHYALRCDGPGGSAVDHVTIIRAAAPADRNSGDSSTDDGGGNPPPPPPPPVGSNLEANLQVSVDGGNWQNVSSVNIRHDQTVDLAWNGTDAIECRGSRFSTGIGGPIFGDTRSSVGGVTLPNSGSPRTYTLTCEDLAGDTDTDSITVNRGAAPPPPSSVDLEYSVNGGTPSGGNTTINAGDTVELVWNSSNASTCTGTNFSTGGNSNNSSGVNVSPAAGGSETYSIACQPSGSNSTDSVTINRRERADLDPLESSQSISVSSSFDLDGMYDSLAMEVDVYNNGGSPAGASTARLELTSKVDSTDRYTGTGSITSLNSGNFDTVNVNLTGGIPFGRYQIDFMADSADVVNESNENNNDFTIGGGAEPGYVIPPPTPNLELTLEDSVNDSIVQNGDNQINWDTEYVYSMNCTLQGPGLATPVTFDPSTYPTDNEGFAPVVNLTSAGTFELSCNEPITNTTFDTTLPFEVIGSIEEN